MAQNLNEDTLLEMYEKMLLIRKFEEKLYFLFLTRVMPGSMHQCNGQEACAVGVCANLVKNDYITSTHRGHGHCLAKGADVKAVMAEMFGKKTGLCKGMGGSMHIADFSVGMLGANGIVAAGIPQAAGAAWACRYLKNDHIAVAFFGDGAANEGVFHEGLNLAAVWKLPVVFVCENNLYGLSTHYRKVTAVENIAARAAAYNMPGTIVDGMDVLAVYETAREAVARARNGGGPTLLECKTYRYMGHSRFEKPSYRTQEEVEEWKQKDPIPAFAGRLKEEFMVSKEAITAIERKVDEEIENAVKYAEAGPDPEPDDYKQYIYA
ncbi:MAG: thiamine pyrophosphate-dependent dehydrogenase E1 component subunit alpha [Victivallaceae bacterium]|nr:thiamine pyrophosphate-dependent dehydrogenase E1 component subunit alpha [Victivallaceae bacterium]